MGIIYVANSYCKQPRLFSNMIDRYIGQANFILPICTLRYVWHKR